MDNEQQQFLDELKKEIDNNHIANAYLIEISDYNNIDLFINNIGKLLLRDVENIDVLIDNNNFPSFKVIDVDGNFIKKEQLLDVKNDFSKTSVYKQRQVYVIKDASKLNASSGNTMLKFLEEPEDDVVAILLTKNRYMVLETIVSRCRVYSINNAKKVELDEDTIKIIETLFSKNKAFLAFNDIIELAPDKKILLSKLDIIEKYLFEVINGKEKLLSNISLNNEKIYKIILIIEKYVERYNFNVNYKLTLDSLIVEILEVIA